VLKQNGFNVRPTLTNDPALRIEAVEQPLTRLADKHPALLVDPGCKNLIAGFEGGYHYKRLAVSGNERFEDRPDKNRFSHVHDALQYMMLGGGEGRAIVSGSQVAKATVAPHRFDVFAHAATARQKRKKVLLRKW